MAKIKTVLTFLAHSGVKEVIFWMLVCIVALWLFTPIVLGFTPTQMAQWASVRGIPAIMGKWIAAW